MRNQYVTTRLKQIAADERKRIAGQARPDLYGRPRLVAVRTISKRALRRFRSTLKRHGLTVEGYDGLLTAQGCRCARCRRPVQSGAPCAFTDRPGPRRGSARLAMLEGRAVLYCGACHSLVKMLDKVGGV